MGKSIVGCRELQNIHINHKYTYGKMLINFSSLLINFSSFIISSSFRHHLFFLFPSLSLLARSSYRMCSIKGLSLKISWDSGENKLKYLRVATSVWCILWKSKKAYFFKEEILAYVAYKNKSFQTDLKSLEN